ncbi:putative acyl-[acyl-carrier-protein]--UDP-N-acetylglucosamine O-acyltransferase mitochondrial isoform X2 [Prunus yedoensis var. nudiflora]|uniref:Putative acyl-[acyl-carrier-protein]--UDP-N-acetylglucosamine O-acyltransferase mitochondrial isoform X2 n=1 Tax=Prunus yedoensis var. nudiflora TaxID=2094558 RepID=A0A314Z9I4_PRUYE|nr:putative acyl-[acyl-carrier-protein]--UDP-N-acetylglucosamine O-acyltransferase mitochondrial isoform X2 [Prunus yedoensis var. nudiflora]
MCALVKVGSKRLSSVLSSLNSLSLRRFCSTLAPGSIHPTAIVHPNAVLGQGVSIGPFCTVGSTVKVGNGCQLYPGSHIFGNSEIGERCVLMTGAVVGDDLPGRTLLGCNNIIGHHAVVGVKCQDLKYKSGDECFLEVGDNNDIREHTSIHRSSKSSDTTVIGNNNLIMGSCHIAHDCKIGNNIIFANNTLLAGHVVVEIRSLQTAYQKIFMPAEISKGFDERLADMEMRDELAHISVVCSMVQSIRDSFEGKRRGICKFRHWNGS